MLSVREASAHVTAPTHRSIVRSPVGAVPIAVLLAFANVDEPPIACLAVATHAAQLGSSSSSSATFAGCASCLRLPPEPNPYRHVAGLELLRYATRNLECMRASGPLFAEPNSMADAEELTQMGFAPAVARDDTELPLLAFISRRPLSELAAADGSHAALRVSNIRASVQFWSLLQRKLCFHSFHPWGFAKLENQLMAQCHLRGYWFRLYWYDSIHSSSLSFPLQLAEPA